ncbi:MAG: MFS transporter [Bdellovibrio sp.]|nr:MAG: MFS transporter [Bdellovibrio sp.]
MESLEKTKKVKWWKKPVLWVQTTYFAEGYPYTIIHSLPEILFKEMGASLEAIGLTSLFHLPWNLKFLWGPLLDQFGTKRLWLLWIEIFLSVLLVSLSFLVAGKTFFLISVVLFLMAILAATHDISIDGFYLEALNEEDQAKYVGYRAMAWRVAYILVSGPIVIFVGKVGWELGFLALAIMMFLLLFYHWKALPKVETPENPLKALFQGVWRWKILATSFLIATGVALENSTHIISQYWQKLTSPITSLPGLSHLSAAQWVGLLLLVVLFVLLAFLPTLQRKVKKSESPFAKAYIDFLSQEKISLILIFIVLYRAGESFLTKMKYPFLKDVVGLTIDTYGLLNGTVGTLAGIIATLLGGWLIAKQGLRRWIWPFVLAQNVLNLLYMWLANYASHQPVSLWVSGSVICLEQFGAGLGTAVFMVYLLRCVDPRHKAAHMAILTALMSLSFTVAGVMSGFLADAVGFSSYFGLSFLITVPSMVMILFIPHLDGREKPESP